jgi:hypothetical protein
MRVVDRSPVVQSVTPVIEASRHVRTHPDVIEQIDDRFWKPFHTTHWPHHFTRRVMP